MPQAIEPHLAPLDDHEWLPSFDSAAALDWGEIGREWVAFSYRPFDPDLDRAGPHGLFLLAPDDRLYGIAALDGHGEPADISPDGRTLLLVDESHVWIADLATRATTLVVETDGASLHAGFAPDGRDVLVTEFWFETSVRLTRHTADMSRAVVLVEHDVTRLDVMDPDYFRRGLTWIGLDDGSIVTASAESIRIRDMDGATVRALTEPGYGCEIVRLWDDDTVLVSCLDPEVLGTTCWDTWGIEANRALWLVPTDGTAADVLYADPPDGCATNLSDAARLGDVVAIEQAACCQCGGTLRFLDAGRLDPWDPGWPVCSPQIVGVRDGTWLIRESPTDVDAITSNLYEISPDLTTRLLTQAPEHSGGITWAQVLGE